MTRSQSDTLAVACIQLNSGDDLQANLLRAANLIRKAAEAGCGLALLPENFSFMGATEEAKFEIAETQESSSVLEFLSEQARMHNMAIVGGSILLQYVGNNRVRNCSPAFSAEGELLAYYDKIHLFDAILPHETYSESNTVESGSQPKMVEMGNWKLGLSICYDLRFPKLYRHYSAHDCNILTVPAAFTVPTGKAHWETLLRARAIENQCYVLAAAQYGNHPGERKTWGHSMIIDPWGKVLAEMENEEGFITAEISLDRVKEVRSILPALTHRRL